MSRLRERFGNFAVEISSQEVRKPAYDKFRNIQRKSDNVIRIDSRIFSYGFLKATLCFSLKKLKFLDMVHGEGSTWTFY